MTNFAWRLMYEIRGILWLVIALGCIPLPTAAQEAWCLANPANCVCSEPLQDTSYTVEWSDPNNWAMLGTTPNTKHCVYETHTNSYMVSWGAQASVSIGTDAGILALLPNRGTAMQRYIRATGDYLGPGSLSATTIRIGHGEISLGSAKRLSMRFYRYDSPDFEFAYQEHVAPHQTNTCGEFGNEPCMCTNGKIAHSSAGAYTRPWVVMQSYNNQIGNTYGFIDSSPWDWRWAGHSGFEGFYGWSKNAGSSPQNLQSLRGHWVRYEIVVRRPRQADSSTQGYDYEIYLTNVTDGGATQQDTKFSNGCTDCMPSGGPNFTWNTGTYPLGDMNALHVEDYRASDPEVSWYGDNYCYGWQAYAYLTIAKWDTDSGQMIGASTEVEGGGTSNPPTGTIALTVRSFVPALLVIGLGLAACAGIGWLARRRGRHYVAHGDSAGQGDPDPGLGEPVRPVPVVGPPATGEPAVQPMVPEPPADELVGIGSESEGRR